MPNRTHIGLTIAFALVSRCAFAADGQILINQSTVMAAGGFPYKITQPGTYKLSGNLVVPDADTTAILVTADNVTIDLNGLSISGPTVCTYIRPTTPVACTPTGSGFGITSSAYNTTVLNGNIHGMGFAGVSLGGRPRIEKIRADSNGSFGISMGFGGLILSCDATLNGGDGIQAGYGEVNGNTAQFNGGNGISLRQDAVVMNNRANNNQGSGIAHLVLVPSPSGAGTVFSGNSATFNNSTGITALCPSLITNNSAFGNPGDNIFTSGSGCVVTNNVAP